MLKKGLLVFSLVSNFATLVGLWLSYASAPATVQNKFASMLLVSGAFASTGGYIAFAWLVMRPLVHTPALTENPSDESSKRVRSEASERKFSSEFVLEVEGTVGTPHWNFFLTNCTTELFRYVQLYPIRSEIGAYEIQFKEILVLNPRERTQVAHDVIPRRTIDREKRVKATLWDFALDNAGEKGNTYFWYYTPVEYRNIDDLPRDGGDVGVCFDVESRVLKTEGAEYWRKQNYNAMFADLEQKSS